jgi:hypothetical protein
MDLTTRFQESAHFLVSHSAFLEADLAGELLASKEAGTLAFLSFFRLISSTSTLLLDVLTLRLYYLPKLAVETK